MGGQRFPIKSLQTTIRILEALVEINGGRVSDVARKVGLPKSTVHDHLTTLQNLGYVTVRGGDYCPGMRFLRMGDLTRRRMELYKSSKEELRRLADETDEHASLVVEEHGKAVIIETVEGEEAIPVQIYNGIRMGMHTAAPGKAILAHLPDARVREIVDEHGLTEMTDNTTTELAELEAELEQIRNQKYAQDDEERLIGMRSIAVPIIDRKDTVRGALTIYGPTNRIEDELFNKHIPDVLLRSGNIVEVLMNYD